MIEVNLWLKLRVSVMVAIIHMDDVEVSWNGNIHHKYEFSPRCRYEDLDTSNFVLPTPMFFGLHNALPLLNHGNVAIHEVD